MVKKTYTDQKSGAMYEQGEVHSWRPPCSCGVELGEAVRAEPVSPKVSGEKVHFWRPPCSCGVSLDDAVE